MGGSWNVEKLRKMQNSVNKYNEKYMMNETDKERRSRQR